ncbi:hypothetical protein [Synergistes jonesii]|uniref:Uncharacterized protein n=1 Tax=Synergistes jonesii TaxID=2754 RepID=A0A073IRB3_9BACT|nr:hypothetical protein [Synergistes jonesii]KEJ92075.1 hypothetical protein EH55_06765 [Synergistes jonesii]MDY2984977.1 hypothetical protein [Synergistes jonesii]OFB62013.1 hypothetical protein JS73_08870 [Synergistes jonesii]OFB62386.1 hypothetical protein JS79_09335 [Synergistes jonesii]OFB64307.1 hypothetical protein JS72_05150 [Synergistes jonesii]
MAGPVQFSLEEIISMLLQRVESLAASDENSKTKQNIIYRVLYKKGILTDDDIMASVKEEYRMLKELGVIKEEPAEDVYRTITDGVLQWVKGDVEGIKKSMADYEKKLQEYAREEAKKPRIEVAGANVLNQLDAAAANKRGKLII